MPGRAEALRGGVQERERYRRGSSSSSNFEWLTCRTAALSSGSWSRPPRGCESATSTTGRTGSSLPLIMSAGSMTDWRRGSSAFWSPMARSSAAYGSRVPIGSSGARTPDPRATCTPSLLTVHAPGAASVPRRSICSAASSPQQASGCSGSTAVSVLQGFGATTSRSASVRLAPPSSTARASYSTSDPRGMAREELLERAGQGEGAARVLTGR